MILIIGCGRSGTKYITKVLQQCGLDVRHEKWGKDGIASFYLAGEGELPRWHFKGLSPKWEFDVILHQVRDPLKVISSSFAFRQPRTFSFINENIPTEGITDPVVWGMVYWYYWNLLAERKASFTYQVEKLEENWDWIKKQLGINCPWKMVKGISKKTNTRSHPVLSWKELEGKPLYSEIKEMAKRYGYY